MRRVRINVDFWLDIASYKLENLTIDADIRVMHQNTNAPPTQIPAKLIHFQTQEIVEEEE